MNLFVLSELHPNHNHVGWSVSHSLEEALSAVCNVHFLYPIQNEGIAWLKPKEPDRPDMITRTRQSLFKSWYTPDELPTLGEGPNVLLVIGMKPRFLLSIFTLGHLLDQFDLRVGYLLDGFDPSQLNRPALPKLDHLFVITPSLATEVCQLHSINSSFLSLATDTFPLNEYQPHRSIDILSYGRTNEQVHAQLQQFNKPESQRLYMHSTFCGAEVHDVGEHRALLNRLLHRSRISLCFEGSYLQRFRGRSPLLYRWFEGWAAGCVIAGKKPSGKGIEKLMDWQDSAIDVPDDPDEVIPFFEALLQDEPRIQEISRRNYVECRLRHDWRYRFRDLFNVLNLPLPDRLVEQIEQLQRYRQHPSERSQLDTMMRGVEVERTGLRDMHQVVSLSDRG
ncbi:glycosyltransferase family 1 protein [Phormidium sp. CLA17]|uniref:glycosyltransferase n=1 Tax=Leptolyngbya sp. Cla-17 TaxID=2803751 RepID=UPI0014918D1F|nr:glycosyltransferase [Leptolyngbya sp. Cla-17]MBM0740909.1 glycosyltransferase family 1 protein [Leptolyngbya sp. Cla-17]